MNHKFKLTLYNYQHTDEDEEITLNMYVVEKDICILIAPYLQWVFTNLVFSRGIRSSLEGSI